MSNYYSNIKPIYSEIEGIQVNNYRKRLASQMDNFTKFTGNGIDMGEKYGMFIINEKKGGLNFYNGPSFSNEYSKPMFQEGMNNLLGVNINTQTIDFTVGIYYFNISEYRELLKIFGPYEIGDLSFSFNPEWRYKVKLKNRSDSSRYILNSEHNQYYYYTEWKLSFELQGPNCLLAVDPYEWAPLQTNSNIYQLTTALDNYHEGQNQIISDLEVPLDIYWSIPASLINSAPSMNLSLSIQVPTMQYSPNLQTQPSLSAVELKLFDLVLEQLPESGIGGIYLNLHYMSEQGLLFGSIDNNTEKLLTLRSSSTDGKRLVKSLQVLKYMLPAGVDLTEYQLNFTPIKDKKYKVGPNDTSPQFGYDSDIHRIEDRFVQINGSQIVIDGNWQTSVGSQIIYTNNNLSYNMIDIIGGKPLVKIEECPGGGKTIIKYADPIINIESYARTNAI